METEMFLQSPSMSPNPVKWVGGTPLMVRLIPSYMSPDSARGE